MLLIVLCALVVAMTATDALVLLGGLAVAFGFQMWPALISVCYVPWFTRAGITVGLALGLVGVVLTENIGGQIAGSFGYELPWGALAVDPCIRRFGAWCLICRLRS